MSQLQDGNIPTDFVTEWKDMFYSGDVWGERTSDAHVAGVYSTDFKLLYGEYHVLQDDESTAYNPNYYPTLLKGDTAESKKYLQNLADMDETANILNSNGVDPAFLVVMTSIRDSSESNDTDVGYFLWAGEVRRTLQEVSDSKYPLTPY